MAIVVIRATVSFAIWDLVLVLCGSDTVWRLQVWLVCVSVTFQAHLQFFVKSFCSVISLRGVCVCVCRRRS